MCYYYLDLPANCYEVSMNEGNAVACGIGSLEYQVAPHEDPDPGELFETVLGGYP